MFLLPYDTHTALFFSQLTLAKDHYCKERGEGGREGERGGREGGREGGRKGEEGGGNTIFTIIV